MTKTITISDKIFDLIKEQLKGSEIKEKKEIDIKIKNRWTGNIIFKSTKTIWKNAVEEAIKSGANLSGADLSRANLFEANLFEANLSDADLSGANLSDADLSGANLSGCLYYMGNGNRNFEALCKAIKTIKHQDGSFDNLTK